MNNEEVITLFAAKIRLSEMKQKSSREEIIRQAKRNRDIFLKTGNRHAYTLWSTVVDELEREIGKNQQ